MKSKAIIRLESVGIRPSLQRIAIMDYMLAHRTHPTADVVYNALLWQMPTLSKMTVYNTLSLLAERGAVLSLGVDARHRRFDGDTSLHGHLVCSGCGEVEDVFYSEAQRQALAATMPKGGVGMEICYSGSCSKCATNNNFSATSII